MKIALTIAFMLVSFGTLALEATYKVSFQGNFSKESHRVKNFPSNPHFSPLIVTSHTGRFSLFAKGSLATPGLKNVAETGNPSVLLNELRDAEMQGLVKDLQRGGGTSGNGSSFAVVNVSLDAPLISAVTMIAPSPDWIIGVNNYSVVEGDDFILKRVIPLYAIDAGTDLGLNFTSKNMPNTTQDPISLLKNISGISIDSPFGFLTIEKM